jgi:dsRNA-specific ribonuclease
MKLKTETPASELKRALTHKSFYKNENGKHNSRYVFCGMYAFKGLVAEIPYTWFPLEGTQLQHTLGNLFKPEILDWIFVYYDLDKLIRYGLEFDANKQRHIFVFGLLGYLYVHAPEEVKNDSTLAEEESVSYRYSRVKTEKKALIVLSERAQQADQQSENYELRQQRLEEIRQQTVEQEKEAKLAAQPTTMSANKRRHLQDKQK